MTLHAHTLRGIQTGPSGPKVGALFDFDHTLVAGFSSIAFFQERLLSGRMAPRELFESVAAAVSFELGRTGFSGLMGAVAGAYRGLSESALDELGEQIFEKYIAREIYPEARALVRAHRSRGHTLAIISSATRYQIEPVARDLGIDRVLCTELEVEGGAFTGRVIHPTCYGEGKVRAARRLAGEADLDLDQSYFYSDSDEDLPLFEAVGRPRPLNPNRGLQRIAVERGWPVRRFRSRGTPTAGDLLRTGLAVGSLATSFMIGMPVGLLNGSRRQGINLAMTTWGELGTALAGIDLVVEGEEHLWSERPAVYVFNHQSQVDSLLICKLLRRDVVAVAKQEVRRNPLVGPFFELAGTVFLDRADPTRAIAALGPAVEALQSGTSIVIAPEGTRSLTTRLGGFKKGAFRLAMQAGVPIVPIVFRNALDALPKHAAVIRPATIEAVVHPPIPTRDWSLANLDEAIERVRALYLETLDEDGL